MVPVPSVPALSAFDSCQTRPPMRSRHYKPSSLVLPDRFEHFYHRDWESLMGECPSDAPAVAAIEIDRSCIRLNDAKVQCFVTTSDYLSLSLREQTLAYPISPAFAKHP